MNDSGLRCKHCQSFMALTPGPDYRHDRAMPPHFMHRGYIIEFRHTTLYVCEPCLRASVAQALAA